MWRKSASLIMRRYSILLCVLLVCSGVLAQQTHRTPTTIVMSRNMKLLEPEWDYVGGGCTCPPIVAGQVWRDDGAWERKDASGQRVFVRVEIVKATSTDATIDYMRRFGKEG